MADFSFLNDDEGDDDLLGPAGESQPYKIGSKDSFRKNLSSMQLDEQRKDQGPVFTPMSDDTSEGEEYDAQGEFQQKRAKAADFAKSETLKGLERLQAAHSTVATNAGRFGGTGAVAPFDYEGTKNKILSSPPERYAEALYQAASQHGLANDDILKPSEDAVTNYKRLTMTEQPQLGAQIQGQLSVQDAPQVKAKIQQLDATIEKTKQDMSLAATSRQKNELKDALQFYESQKRQLQSRLPQEQSSTEAPVDKDLDMNAIFTSSALPRQEAVQAMTEMRRFVETHGISVSDKVTPSTFPVVYNNLITELFNPQVAARMHSEIAGENDEKEKPKQQGEQKSTFGSDKLEQDPRFQHNQQMIDEKEAQRKQIWQELAHSGTFKNVGDVIGFVLTSLLIGPRGAAIFFSNMHKNGNLRTELDMLDRETTNLYHQQNSYIQLAQHARQMAATEEHQKQTEAETARHHWAVEGYMKMKGGDKSAWAPEDKRTDQALQHAYRYQRATLDTQEKKVMEMGKVIDRGPMDPDFKAIQGVLGKERQKLAKMRGDFDEWRNKVNEWYRAHGAGEIEPSGTPLNAENFNR